MGGCMWRFLVLGWAVACGGDKTPTTPTTTSEGDADTDADADTDSDADTDTDADTDADTDTSDTSEAEPDCDDVTPPLDEQEFSDVFQDKYCWNWDRCGSGPCPLQAGGTVGSCRDFDAALACACLDATYTCNMDFPGLYYVETPEVCLRVCGDYGTPTGGSGSYTYTYYGGSGGYGYGGSGRTTTVGGSGRYGGSGP